MKFMHVLSVGAVLAAAALACQTSGRQEMTAIRAVLQHLKDTGVDLDALAYRNRKGEATIMSFDTGDLDWGRAVYFHNADAAYWVKYGVVYVVDENARELSPGLESAPAHITRSVVIAVAD